MAKSRYRQETSGGNIGENPKLLMCRVGGKHQITDAGTDTHRTTDTDGNHISKGEKQ